MDHLPVLSFITLCFRVRFKYLPRGNALSVTSLNAPEAIQACLFIADLILRRPVC